MLHFAGLAWPAPSLDDGSEAIIIHHGFYVFLAGPVAFAVVPHVAETMSLLSAHHA